MAFSGKVFNLDKEWRFHLGEYVDEKTRANNHAAVYSGAKSGGLAGPATKNAFDDSGWQQVELPHDYIREADFSPDEVGNHGSRVKSNAWYRKTFAVDSELAGKHALLVFGGISTSSVIFLNGSVVYRSDSVYTEIAIDVTDRLYFDRINTLAVYTRGHDTEGWWYEGAGIYRHAYLYIKDQLHFAHNGVFAKPTLADKAKNLWDVEMSCTLENTDYTAKTVLARAALYDGDLRIAASEGKAVLCPGDGKMDTVFHFSVENPTRWDIDDPKRYTVKAELVCEGEVIDTADFMIGFRTFYMDPDKGAFLNDRSIKLKGTCNHQDHAGVGVAVPDSIQYYRIRRLKEMGCNAYRCAHNPPAREILDACDAYGVLVMDENRKFEASESAIANLEMMVRRDRNHPCIVFWSLFNEEPLQNCAEGLQIFRRLKNRLLRLDDSRYVIGAVNDTFHPGGTGENMDVLAMNYGIYKAESVHKDWPNKPMMGCENNSAFSTRGCYQSDREGAQVTNCYDEEKAPWGQTIRENWAVVRKYDFFAGCFIWTGFDYRGEPTPFKWPSCSSQFGLMDLCGFPKDAYYFCQATYLERPMLHILPHWNWKEGETVRVMTVTNCDEVELLLNGKSLGRYENDVCEQREWQVDFVPGTLSAIGYNKGEAVVTAERKTAGVPVAIRLVADRTTLHNAGGDTVPVRVSVVDANGTEVPEADHLVRFAVEGDGAIAGVGNGNPNSHEPEHLPYRHLFAGLCQVLVHANTGAKTLKLIATCDGMESAEVVFDMEERTAPAAIASKANWEINGMLATVTDEAEKPDPAKVYSDDDMNSFSPMVIEARFNAFKPSKFKSGWRVLRVPVTLPAKLPEGKRPVIEIAAAICKRAEFYVHGKEIFTAEPAYKAPIVVPLPTDCGRDFEVRVLLQAREDVASNNGLGLGMALTFLD